jgi:hypothetical protein
MTKNQFDKFMDDVIIPQIKDTRDKGQKEYAQDLLNVFANFRRTGARVGISPEQSLSNFLLKHIDGICAHVKGYESQREPVQGRIKDAMVYLALLWAMVEKKKE